MYLPKSFEPPDIDTLQQFVRAHPFGVLVTMTRGGLEGNHIPFLIDAEPAPYGTLRGHVARANPIWQEVQLSTDALVIFQGPDSFISPSWYPSKRETACSVVPTWNYVVVHAHGHLRVIQNPAWLRAHVEALTNRHEQDRDVRLGGDRCAGRLHSEDGRGDRRARDSDHAADREVEAWSEPDRARSRRCRGRSVGAREPSRRRRWRRSCATRSKAGRPIGAGEAAWYNAMFPRARVASSVVEHLTFNQGVPGSIPGRPTSAQHTRIILVTRPDRRSRT